MIILPSGRQTYCVEYRNTERVKKRLKLGVHGQITTEEARELVKKRLGQVAHGEDPATDKKHMNDLVSMTDLAQNYLERHGYKKRPKSIHEDEKLLNNVILPALGRLKVVYVTRRDIQSLHKSFQDRPYQANRTLALLSKMFSLAVSWEWRVDNPVLGIERYQEEKRDRWLDQEELDRMWEVLDQYPTNPTAYVFSGFETGSGAGATLLRI